MVVSFNMIIINIDQISYLSPSVVATTAWSSLSPQQWDFEQKIDIQVGYSVLLDCKDGLWRIIPMVKVSLQTINDFSGNSQCWILLRETVKKRIFYGQAKQMWKFWPIFSIQISELFLPALIFLVKIYWGLTLRTFWEEQLTGQFG